MPLARSLVRNLQWPSIHFRRLRFGLMPSFSAQLEQSEQNMRAAMSFYRAAPPSAILPLHSFLSRGGARSRCCYRSGQTPAAVEVSSRWRWAAAHDERCHAFALGYIHECLTLDWRYSQHAIRRVTSSSMSTCMDLTKSPLVHVLWSPF